MESGGNLLSLHVEGMPWERVKHISVDREGEYILNLRPKLDKVAHRILCEVRLQDNVKIITFRSSFNVENRTLVPVEMVILDHEGNLTTNIRKIGKLTVDLREPRFALLPVCSPSALVIIISTWCRLPGSN